MKVTVALDNEGNPQINLALDEKEFEIVKYGIYCYYDNLGSGTDEDSTRSIKMSEQLNKIKLK